MKHFRTFGNHRFGRYRITSLSNMIITLYRNLSEKNKVNKSLVQIGSYGGSLRDSSSIIKPEVVMAYSDPGAFNYVQIDTFGRYYFVDDVTVLRTGLLQISLSVDVLESFKSQLGAVPVILSDSEVVGNDNYLPGTVWRDKVKETTNIINFPSGLRDSGEFILITAGG